MPVPSNFRIIAKKYVKHARTHETAEVAAVIIEENPEITEGEAEIIAELAAVIAEETAAVATGEGGDPAADPPAENADEIIDMPEDGICPPDYMPSEDGLTCIKPVEGDPEGGAAVNQDPVEPDADGNCPDGYVKDGEQCIPEGGGESENPEVLPIGEDGTCPEGYRATEDGTACIEEEIVPEAENILMSFYHNTKFIKKSPKERGLTIRAAFKRAHITPCGCHYIKGHKPKHRTFKLNKHSKRQLKHSFKWSVPMELNKETFEQMMLVKGVAMVSGEAKRGELMNRDNVIYGAGAMSAAAMFGLALCDIDHFENALPKEYVEKYGKAINEPYPVAAILDAAHEEITLEPSGEKAIAVEFIASCSNPLVYSMIHKGKFKGCSVVDYYRKENCSACGKSEKCGCSIEGSHFITNTFVLEGVPNANGTWVAPVTEEDIGKIITISEENTIPFLKEKMAKSPHLTAKYNFLKLARRQHSRNVLEDYLDSEGKFENGQNGIVTFLIDEKGIPDPTAKDMAAYLFKHPSALSQEQFEFMSAEDLVAWFKHIVDKNMKKVNKFMADSLQKLATRNHADLLGKETVNYRAGEGQTCEGCRFYSPMFDMDTGEITQNGWCAIVAGDIDKDFVCDRHETIEQSQGEGGDPAAEGAEQTVKIDGKIYNAIPMPEEGGCPEGFHASEDGAQCISDEPAPEVEPPMAADGFLPKHLQKYRKNKSKHSTVPIEKNPVQRLTKTYQVIQRKKDIIKKLKSETIFFAANGAKRHGIIQSEIEKLKKTS